MDDNIDLKDIPEIDFLEYEDALPDEAPPGISDVTEEEPETEEEREARGRKWRILLRVFLVLLLLALLAGGVYLALTSEWFNVKKIAVEGNEYYSNKEIINMSGIEKGGNIFTAVDTGKATDNLERDPYFAKVRISRKLPDTIRIRVSERTQVAAVKYGGKFVVIDKDGFVLRISETDPKLTVLEDLTLSRIDQGALIEVEESSVLADTLDMLSIMREEDMYFKKIKVSAVTIQAFINDYMIVKGSPAQMRGSIESGDLQKVVNKLFQDDIKRGTLSLGNDNYISFSPEI